MLVLHREHTRILHGRYVPFFALIMAGEAPPPPGAGDQPSWRLGVANPQDVILFAETEAKRGLIRMAGHLYVMPGIFTLAASEDVEWTRLKAYMVSCDPGRMLTHLHEPDNALWVVTPDALVIGMPEEIRG